MEEKTVIIMRGVPGSGKSTYARQYFPRAFLVSADLYHTDELGNYNWKGENVAAAHSWAKKQFKEALERGEALVLVDNTNTEWWEMEPYYDMAEDYGYSVKVVRMQAPPDVCSSRNVHGVPEEAVHRMHDRMEDISALIQEVVVSTH